MATASMRMLRPRKFKELETNSDTASRIRALLETALTHASVRGGQDGAFRQRAAGVHRRPRARPRRSPRSLNEPIPTPARANSPAATTAWCAAKPAPRWPATSGSAHHLILSESEADSGGRDKTTILADAAEALLGAVFLDGGLRESARRRAPALAAQQSEPVPEVAVDAKSALQEWAQGQGLGAAQIYGRVAQGPRSCAALHGRSAYRRQGARAGRGSFEAHCRAGRGDGAADA